MPPKRTCWRWEKLGIGSPIAGKDTYQPSEPITHEALINAWLKADGFPPETRRMPLGLAKFLGAALETIYRTLHIQQEPPLTRFMVEQLSTAHWFDITAARRDLGYTPRVSVAEGLARLSQYLARERMQRRG